MVATTWTVVWTDIDVGKILLGMFAGKKCIVNVALSYILALTTVLYSNGIDINEHTS